jgi:hypothetical protein
MKDIEKAPVGNDEEVTEEDKAMYAILFGRDWDEDYPEPEAPRNR